MVTFYKLVGAKPLLCLLTAQLFLVFAQDNYSPDPIMKTRYQMGKELFQERLLQVGRQITTLLLSRQTKLFFYLDNVSPEEHSLSVTVIPCSGPIKWSLQHRMQNESIMLVDSELMADSNRIGNLGTYVGDGLNTVTLSKATVGLYLLQMTSLDKDINVNIYVSLDPGGPYDLTIPQDSNLRLTPQRNRKLDVRWDASLVNPQNTNYCLVINSRREYPALCGATEASQVIARTKFPIPLMKEKYIRTQKKAVSDGGTPNDTMVICVGQKTHLKLTRLVPNQHYYFDLFATNIKTNLTIPYGKSNITYNFMLRPFVLQDGKPLSADLKKYEGKVSFRFKAWNHSREVNIYVLVCGGSVKVEIKRKKGRRKRDVYTAHMTRVDGYKKFILDRPFKGEYFYIKISTPDFDELNRIKKVEVFATLKPAKFPYATLPEDPTLYEYKSSKTCDSVTIGWVPVTNLSKNKYCVLVTENDRSINDYYSGNYQCSLPSRKNVVSFTCAEVEANSETVNIYKIVSLKPGRGYTIQVTVKKRRGKTLSYKPLRVYTKHICDDRLRTNP